MGLLFSWDFLLMIDIFIGFGWFSVVKILLSFSVLLRLWCLLELIWNFNNFDLVLCGFIMGSSSWVLTGSEVQSVLGFLKGKTSSFFLQSSLFVLIRPCLGKIFFLLVKVWYPVICVLFCWYKWALDFLLLCSIIALFLLEKFFFLPVEFFFFIFVVFVGGVLCLFYFYDTCLWFCLFWACESGVSLAGRVIFSFCVGLRCVECRSGTIYLSASLGWVAGLYRFSFFWALLWWVQYDLFECWPGVSGGAVQAFFWYYLSVFCSLSC